MTEQHPITPPPPHLLKKFSAQAQDEAKKRNGAGYLKTFATLCIEWAMNSKTTPNDRQIRSSEIEPPPELVKQWLAEFYGPESMPGMAPGEMVLHVAAVAARWGYEQRGASNEAELQKARDEELEACCEWLLNSAVDGAKTLEPYIAADPETFINAFRAARRPKPPSLAEEALGLLNEGPVSDLLDHEVAVIRRALERLQELEGQGDG